MLSHAALENTSRTNVEHDIDRIACFCVLERILAKPRVDPYLADVDIGHGRLADAHERSHTQLQIRDDATRWRINGRARQIELCAAQSRRRIADLGIRSSRGAEALARLLEFGFRRDSAASAVSRAAFAWSRRSELSEARRAGPSRAS
jgi:hypothetical protein